MKSSGKTFLMLFVVLVVVPSFPLQADEKDARIKPKLEKVFSNFLRRELEIGRLRWVVYPFKLAGTELKLWEKPGLLMAEAPRATMRISLKTLTSWRLRVADMTFKDAQLYLRFTHDGKTNLGSMIADLAGFARSIYKPGQHQKVAYDTFRIENASLHVIDATTGGKPLEVPFIVNARGDISGLGPQTKFPFHLKAVAASTTTPANIDVTGTISNRPIVQAVARDLPVRAMVDYLPVVQWFDGTLNATGNFSKAGIYTFWRLNFSGDQIKTWTSLPFPVIKVDGKLHPFAVSSLNLAVTGTSTTFNVALRIKNLISKKVSLSIQSQNADIAECIDWCRSGALMNGKPKSEEALKAEMKKPLLWQVTGKANIDAQFSSILGQHLLREVDGQITMKITDGRLTEMPGFVKALTLLKRSYLIQKTATNEPGLPFKTIDGIIDIKDGVAVTRDLIVLDSPVLNVAFKGRVNFPKNVINAQIRLGPAWVEVKGPLENPAVQLIKE